MSLTAAERETSIVFDDDSETAYITTYSRPLIRKLKGNPGVTITDEGKFQGSAFVSASFSKELITIRKPRAKRNLTDKQKADLKERGQRLARSRKN